MYRLLIVDDEEIEREGMACFIPWENYQIQLVGTAWNGVEALEQVRQKQPDIVLTDIKMPVMDGIGLIRAVKKEYPNVEFIVLSGYGEYEYTSQAMELGVRHYVLKPCDEKRISEVLEKVKTEIEKKKSQKQKMENYQQAVERLLPKAREQILRNLLLERADLPEEGRFFLNQKKENKNLRVLGLQENRGFDKLEQFIFENVFKELLGEEQVLESTCIDRKVVFLIKNTEIETLEIAVRRMRREMVALTRKNLLVAVSTPGKVSDLGKRYVEIQELFQLSYAFPEGNLLSRERFQNNFEGTHMIFNSYDIQKADSFEKILFEIYLMFLKMKIEKFDRKKIEEVCRWGAKLIGLSGWETEELPQEEWKLVAKLTSEIAEKKLPGYAEEEQRMRKILLVIYQYLNSQKLSIQYISKEILYMNEEYFGRVFFRYMKEKFSVFVLNRRITLARQLLRYYPDMKLSQLASMVGYAPDGQYFSKAFRKQTQMSPTEYRERIKQEKVSE